MSTNERRALEELIRESRQVLANSSVREEMQQNIDVDGLLHRARERQAIRDYTTEMMAAKAANRITRELGVNPDSTAEADVVSRQHIDDVSPDTLEPIEDSEPVQLRPHVFAGWARAVAAPGQVVLVIGDATQAEDTVTTARRIAARAEGSTQVLIGAPKSLLPGSETRVKNGGELANLVVDAGNATTVLAVAKSPVAAHQKLLEGLLAAIEPAQVWLVLDAARGADQGRELIANAPGTVRPTAIAALNVWEMRNPSWLRALGVPLGMIDFAPASAELWAVVRRHCIL